MTTILDDAEQRIAPAIAAAQTRQKEIIEGMREEIGRSHYEQAKKQLPELERALAETYRPFITRLASQEVRSKSPLPSPVKAQLTEMATLCDTVPRTTRTGIEGWDHLTVPLQKDGRSIDISVRAKWVHDIRFCLKNWDGVRSGLNSLKGQVELYVQESGWPAAR